MTLTVVNNYNSVIIIVYCLQVAALYMCTRLIVNITQVYIPMYTLETLSLSKVCTINN